MEDSLILNEILSNYGNQSKISKILEKNKQAKQRLRESAALVTNTNAASQHGQNRDFTDRQSGKTPSNFVKKTYTRSRKTQVYESNLGYKDLNQEVTELKSQ